MYNPFTLDGKTILITGASSGIGRATAIECSRIGAKVIITGRNMNNLETTFHDLEGKDHLRFCYDFKTEKTPELIVSNLPIINGIVHCAGITKNIPFQYATKANIDEVLDINFYIPAEITRLILKSKRISKNGSIIFISSVSGVYCSAIASSIYSASKGAINGLVKGMALDLAPKGIRVNCINPGIIESNIFKAGIITSEQLAEDKKHYPLKRFGRPEEVAYAAIYLLSDASSWVTGSNLLIDGGFTLL